MIAFLKLSKGVYSLYFPNFSLSRWIYSKYSDFWSTLLLSYKTAEKALIVYDTSVFALFLSNADMLGSVFKGSFAYILWFM